MRVSVLIPYRADTPERAANFEFTSALWPYPVFVGSGPDGPFCRGAAINEAAAQAPEDTDVFLIADSDLLLAHPANQAREAAEAALTLDGYVVAFTSLAYLGGPETAAVLAGEAPWMVKEFEWRDMLWGGVAAVAAPLWRKVGGFDSGFVGWGYEDGAFLAACSTVGAKDRMPGVCYHLDHPEAPRDPALMGANQLLALRWRSAADNVAAMEALIEERR